MLFTGCRFAPVTHNTSAKIPVFQSIPILLTEQGVYSIFSYMTPTSELNICHNYDLQVCSFKLITLYSSFRQISDIFVVF